MLYEFKDGVNKYLKTLRDNVVVNSLNDVIEFNSSFADEIKNDEPRSFWKLLKFE